MVVCRGDFEGDFGKLKVRLRQCELGGGVWAPIDVD